VFLQQNLPLHAGRFACGLGGGTCRVAVLETDAGRRRKMSTIKDEAVVESTLSRKELQAREGAAAMAEYQAARRSLIDNTARLREARLAREAAEVQAKAAPTKAAPVKVAPVKVAAAKVASVKVAPAKAAPPKKVVRVAGRRK
jgi:hypothetical protein